MAAEIAGTSYAELIKEQLLAERSTKESLEARGIAVITTSGVLVSLLFGLGALVTSAKTFQLPQVAKVLLIVAVILFVLAAGAGLVLNSPRKYEEAKLEYLRKLTVKDIWEGGASLGTRRAAEMRIKILAKAREVNAAKAKWLLAAVILEVGAVGFVAGSVIASILG